ncbi:lipoprotein N-acyltransferase Lnb domain-containing protein [Euzebyella saccharophila]|uniref:DUF4105 domain-containing protein n=1 Tax=Euzebyella saccharophila TaxID=679664 RepID=A0ABV8JKP9_9FLAO|nr:DUF4105 domain-containing protein [Euzebyella saccharophila]
MRQVFLLLLTALCLNVYSQKVKLTPQSQLSIITCGPGDQVYSSFGHSSIRVYDASQKIDVVYNYGTFDFTTPNFTLKFARGKLNYTLARQNFPYFLLSYEEENRWVKEQILNLNLQEKQKLFQFLENNYKPENRDYKYDFFYDNCSTKIWDIFKENYGNELQFKDDYLKNKPDVSHRALIRSYVSINSWLGFGIDLALGSLVDDNATPFEHMFLPDYTMEQIAVATLNDKALAQDAKTLFESKPVDRSTFFLLSPAFWFLLILIAVLLLTFLDFKNNTRRRWLDFVLFLVPGLIGAGIIFLWFFTDHTQTADNYNILWAFPAHLFVAFIVSKRKGPNWVAKYALFSLGLILVSAIVWLVGLQSFSPVFILLWLTLAVRYLFLFWSYQKPLLA